MAEIEGSSKRKSRIYRGILQTRFFEEGCKHERDYALLGIRPPGQEIKAQTDCAALIFIII
jgi:hypothetical protein